jgi:hypothetical protein
MRYFLELPDGRCIEVDTPERARRYAELFIILSSGKPPVPFPLSQSEVQRTIGGLPP